MLASLIPFLLRYWQYIAIVAAVLGAAWYLDHRGYKRAEAEQAARMAEAERQAERIEKALLEQISQIDQLTAARLSAIDVHHRTVVQPIIERETRNDPRYAAPECSVSGSLLDTLNQARRGTAGPAE